MTGTKTLTIIKPCAVKKGFTGAILDKIIKNGFQIAALKMIWLTKQQAESFYAIHKGKPFYESLVQFMTSGEVIVSIIEKEDAVAEYRKLMGATNPDNAETGTIRKMFGQNIQQNAVHGSDTDENAEIECNFFFSLTERYSKY
jgi:nucleoside-diphosphate kinase